MSIAISVETHMEEEGRKLEIMKRFKRNINWLLSSLAAYTAKEAKNKVFSGAIVPIRTGQTRENVRFWKNKGSGVYTVGVKNEGTGANKYLGRVQGRYDYIGSLYDIAEGAGAKKVIDDIMKKIMERQKR